MSRHEEDEATAEQPKSDDVPAAYMRWRRLRRLFRIPDLPGPAKVADRPHIWTVGLGLVSPALSLVALYLSMQALETSELSMKVGQRAYLSIENGVYGPDARGLSVATSDAYRFDYVNSFEIKNLGNTPAYVESVTVEFRMLNYFKHRSFNVPGAAGDQIHVKIRGMATIGPKASLFERATGRYTVTTPGGISLLLRALSSRGGTRDDVEAETRAIWTVSFADAFGEKQKPLSWCWQINFENGVANLCK